MGPPYFDLIAIGTGQTATRLQPVCPFWQRSCLGNTPDRRSRWKKR